MTKPTGYSLHHWMFQNKINKPTLQDNVLRYSSGPEFSRGEAAAWWLCYDTIRMISQEISSCNALMEDLKIGTFAAKRVYGAESTIVLAKEIRTKGWRPIEAAIRASNPANLAKTLGGENLYGKGPMAPLRELLQNAVDAVRARRQLESRSRTWGAIRLLIEETTSEDVPKTWIHVDDSGIGMSERVMAGPLLDFGSSLWNSSVFREEFPGLESKGIRPIGKFGIGFFSVFLLGGVVRVVSRKLDESSQDTRVLEFDSLSTRPLLRDAAPDELPLDYNTRVSVRLDDPEALHLPRPTRPASFEDTPFVDRSMSASSRDQDWLTLSKLIMQLVAAVDVSINVSIKPAKLELNHHGDWEKSEPRKFLEVVAGARSAKEVESLILAHSELVQPILDEDGNVVGRAALNVMPSVQYDRRSSGMIYISVGGFLYRPGAPRSRAEGRSYGSIIGVLIGDTERVTREVAYSDVPAAVIGNWASEQADRLDVDGFTPPQNMEIGHRVLDLGGKPGKIPICYNSGEFVSHEVMNERIMSRKEVWIPLTKSYKENFYITSADRLSYGFFTMKISKNVFVFSYKEDTNEILNEAAARAVSESNKQALSLGDFVPVGLAVPLQRAIDFVRSVWGEDVSIAIVRRQIFLGDLYVPPDERWVLILRKATDSQ